MRPSSHVLLLDAGVDCILGAFVKPGEDRILNLLAFNEIDHHRRCLVAHFERSLADEGRYKAFLGDRHFVADCIAAEITKSPLAIRSAIGLKRSR